MKFVFAVRFLLTAAVTISLAHAESSRDYFTNFYHIPAAAFGEVFTLDSDKLLRNAAVLGAGALIYTQDEAIRDFWQDDVQGKNSHWDRASSRFLYDIGSPTGAVFLHGATSLTAFLTDDDYLMDTTLLSLQSVLLSQLFAEGSKALTSRPRPRHSGGEADRWGDGGSAFFSGHASGAFASMTIFAERYRHHRGVYWGAYGLATAVSLSRINEDAHWASDVFAGAVVGYGLAQLTLRYSPFDSSDNTYLMPLISDEYIGLSIYHAF